MPRSLAFAALLALALCACTKRIDYTPDPNRSDRPDGEIPSILKSSGRGFPVVVQMTEESFTVQQGPWDQTVLYADIGTVDIVKKHGDYNLYVKDASGSRHFEWGFESLNDAEHLADALVSIARRAGHGPR